jgi:cell division protein FtsB
MYMVEFAVVMLDEVRNLKSNYARLRAELERVRAERDKTAQRIKLLEQLLALDHPELVAEAGAVGQ